MKHYSTHKDPIVPPDKYDPDYALGGNHPGALKVVSSAGQQYIVAPSGVLGLPVVMYREGVEQPIMYFANFRELRAWLDTHDKE